MHEVITLTARLTPPSNASSTPDPVELQLVSWLQRIIRSHTELMSLLNALHRSHVSLLAGEPVPDVEAQLLQVERALRSAEAARVVYTNDPSQAG
jgi:hypothetical protein